MPKQQFREGGNPLLLFSVSPLEVTYGKNRAVAQVLSYWLRVGCMGCMWTERR
jgi:hypothetical protein